MGIFNKDKKRSVMLKYINGIEVYQKDLVVDVTLKEDVLEIESKHAKGMSTVKLTYEQIIGVNCITGNEVINANKSVVGRAVVGGVLLGPLGAIIGGTSGVGTKVENKKVYYIILNYKSKDGEVKVVSFEVIGFTNWNKFIKELRSKIINNEIDREVYL